MMGSETCHYDAEDKQYFKAYSDFLIHKDMVGDTVRTNTYRKAILSMYKLFYKKVVLDVGCGCGILSLFCAQAGAKKVYAVDASNMVNIAEEVVSANGFQDKIVVIKSKIEDVRLPEKVDVIVSEWMGYLLLHECMLQSILYARDKFLRPGGKLFPEKACIHVAAFNTNGLHWESVAQQSPQSSPVGNGKSELHTVAQSTNNPSADPPSKQLSGKYWELLSRYYGVDLSPMNAAEHSCSKDQVISICIDEFSPHNVISNSKPVLEIDLNSVSVNDVKEFTGAFDLLTIGDCALDSIVTWFDVTFPGGTVLTTSPFSNVTHWCQCLLKIDPPQELSQGTKVAGSMTFSYNKELHRNLEITLQVTLPDQQFTRHYAID